MQQVCHDSDVRLWRCVTLNCLPRASPCQHTLPAYPAKHSSAMSAGAQQPPAGVAVPTTPEELLAGAVGGPPAPHTPEALVEGAGGAGHDGHEGDDDAAMFVPEERQGCPRRWFRWPRQGGERAPRKAWHLLRDHRDAVWEMQEMHQSVYQLLMFTENHLEAALGRNLGNRLCPNPDNLGMVLPVMTERLRVPYSLHELGLRFDCLCSQV